MKIFDLFFEPPESPESLDGDVSEHLVEQSSVRDWWRPSNHNSVLWCGVVAGALPIVIYLILAAFENETNLVVKDQLFVAVAFVTAEAALAIVGLIWLRNAGGTEARLLHDQLNDLMVNEGRKNLSNRAHSSLESSIETIDSAYQTISNAIIVFGMVGSAGFLLVGMTDAADADAMNAIIGLAPKAFSATGFAIWCGLAVGIAGLLTRISYRQAGLGRISELLDDKDLGQNDEVDQFKRLVDGVQKFTDIVGTKRVSGLVNKIGDVNRNLPRLIDTQNNLLKELQKANRTLSGDNGIQAGLVTVSKALGVVNETGHAKELATIAKYIPDLATSQKKTAEQTERLASAMGVQSASMLDQHLEKLQKLTGELAEQLLTSSQQEVLRHLGEIKGRTEKVVEEAYKIAFTNASEYMLRDLRNANQELQDTSGNLKHIKDDFSNINDALALLHGTMAQNTATVRQRAEAYGQAASLVAKKVEQLTEALVGLGRVGDDQTLDAVVESLEAASTALQSASINLLDVQGRVQQKITDARNELTGALGPLA